MTFRYTVWWRSLKVYYGVFESLVWCFWKFYKYLSLLRVSIIPFDYSGLDYSIRLLGSRLFHSIIVDGKKKFFRKLWFCFKQWNICVATGNMKGVPSRNYIQQVTQNFVFKDLVDINMTLLWWMGVGKNRYQFIRSSWDFLSMITP